jgi:hypothetical protein
MKKLPKLNFAFPVIIFLTSLFAFSCKKVENTNSGSSVTTHQFYNKVKNLDLTNSLIAYWPLNGNGNDLSGNGNNGSLYNVTPTTDRFGNGNSAYHFDGSSSYISVADNPSLRLSGTDFTFNAWVKMDSAYNSSYGSQIMTKRYSGANNGWTWSVTGQASTTVGVLSYGPGGGSTNAFGTKTISLNQWHMVTSVYSASAQQLTIYIDGALDNITSGITTPNAAVTAGLYIGRDNPAVPSGGYFFHGSMDDIRIYNKALSQSAVIQLLKEPTNGLIAYWPLNGNANDLSGNGHDGSLYNVTPTTDRFGNANSAYHFDGVTSYISVPDSSALRLSLANFTLNAWIKMDSTYNSSYGSQIMTKRYSGANNGWTWSVTGMASSPIGVLSYGPGGGSTNAFGTKQIFLNQWHMVTSVYNGSTQQLSIYIDGVLDNVTSGIVTPNAAVTAELCIGRDNPAVPSGGYFFQGSMDDLRIYGVALSASQITQLYKATY